MMSRHTQRLLPAAFIVVMLGIAALLGWPTWMWFPLTALVAGALLLGMYVGNGRGRASTDEEETQDGTELPVEPPYLEIPVVDVPVSSSLDEYPFVFSAMVRWRTRTDPLATSHGNPGALAVASVLWRVEHYTATEHPRRADSLCHRLEGLLGQPVHEESGVVTAYATEVRLHLRGEDRQHLGELEEHRRSIGSWERQREHERSRREYLGEDVLRSPGSAIVWWLSRHEDEIQRATDLIGPLSCLSAAANDQQIPDGFRHIVGRQASRAADSSPGSFELLDDADTAMTHLGQNERASTEHPEMRHERVSALLDEMGFTPGSDERAAFVYRIAHMMSASGRPQAAERLQNSLVDEIDPHDGDEDEQVQGRSRSELEEPHASKPTASPVQQERQWWAADQAPDGAGRTRPTEGPPPDVAAPTPMDSYSPPWSDADERKP
ncbi:hypothetical protein ABZ953_35215 [Streptomyces sp. NPDC046465]|uniref:hypothetical protein n=1 Tax=Streptomyces sp. NPDC046465 TaxID=3155810 RepID=UPI0033F5B584